VTSFSLLQQLCTASHGIFYMVDKHLFVGELNNDFSPDKYFKTVFDWLSLA